VATVSGRGGQNVRIWYLGGSPPYHSLELPAEAISGKAELASFSIDGTLLVKMLSDGKARIWRLPLAPKVVRQMQLRTWIALGAQYNEHGEVIAIPSQQWQMLREELYYPEVYSLPAHEGEKDDWTDAFHLLNERLRTTGRWSEALEGCREVVDILEKLVADFPEVREHRQSLVTNYRMLADVLRDMGQLEQAEAAYQQAKAIEKEVVPEKIEDR
jgi:tetratricopeptide (TPR) repeat protein